MLQFTMAFNYGYNDSSEGENQVNTQQSPRAFMSRTPVPNKTGIKTTKIDKDRDDDDLNEDTDEQKPAYLANFNNKLHLLWKTLHRKFAKNLTFQIEKFLHDFIRFMLYIYASSAVLNPIEFFNLFWV